MNLKILLPYQIFAQQCDVSRIVAETTCGSYGLLPHRLDCVAALVPGILVYESRSTLTYVAVDGGVLVKSGADVRVSVRRAASSSNLHELHTTVLHGFRQIDEQERTVRTALAKMEAGLLRQLARFTHGR